MVVNCSTPLEVYLTWVLKVTKQYLERCRSIRNTAASVANIAMNGYFPSHGFQQVKFGRNPCALGFIQPPTVPPQYASPGQGQFYLAQHQLQTGLALANLAPQQQIQLRAQLQGLGRIFMQQQFMQNFSFTNSSFYHQIPQAQNCKHISNFEQVDPTYSAVCANIKDEILEQLTGDSNTKDSKPLDSLVSDSTGSVSREASRKGSPSSTRSPSPDITESIMEARGLK